MTTSMNHETAIIIPFPIGGRMNGVSKSRAQSLAEQAALAPVHDYGSWYHEEAVAESTEGRKPQA